MFTFHICPLILHLVCMNSFIQKEINTPCRVMWRDRCLHKSLPYHSYMAMKIRLCFIYVMFSSEFQKFVNLTKFALRIFLWARPGDLSRNFSSCLIASRVHRNYLRKFFTYLDSDATKSTENIEWNRGGINSQPVSYKK